jgi:hypothetical protein
MSSRFRSPDSQQKNRYSARLRLEALESRELLSVDLSAAALALVPTNAVTAQAVRSGNWSDPGTWLNRIVPAASANVLIPNQVSVTLDGTTNSVHWVRVDGTLQFATNVDTNLVIDTVVVTMNGALVIGTASNPISAQHHALITFTANGPINTAWDPNFLSRGLVAMGTVTMYGAATTPFVTLAQNATQGATTLTLSAAPTNWHIGDEIVLGGTYAKANEDEDLRILGIQGNQVTVSTLSYAHTASNSVPVYLTDVTRNIVMQSQNPSVIGDRGHVLLMCSDMTNIHYAEFLGLDRTDKSQPINDPKLDANGRLVGGTGTNPRYLYALGIWDGNDRSLPPGIVDGSTVVGSPGWGFVNHSSNVNFTNDVAFNVSGASFVAEAGDEVGSFSHDLAIHSLGTGAEDFYDPSRVPLQDWAHEGDGFWLQGNGVSVTNNVAIGQAAAGFYYFVKPYTLPVQDVTPSTAPLAGFQNNLAESDDYGAFLRYESNGGTVDGFTAHNCITGFKEQYCAGITLRNSFLYGSPFSDYGIFLPVEAAQGFVAQNNLISGWPVGIHFSEEYSQTLLGGTFSNNQIDIEIPNAIAAGRSITISNPTFSPSTARNHFDIFWLQEFNAVFSRSISAFFVPDIVIYNSVQLYAPWQNANYVPFAQQPSGFPLLPASLMGKTNSQLLGLYGLAMGGSLAPTSLSLGVRTNGTAGPLAAFRPNVSLASAARTDHLTGYQLQYTVANGPTITVPGSFNLIPGWNTVTILVSGGPATFIVFGTPYTPTNLGVLAGYVTHSYEYYSNFVSALYQRYFGRSPDGTGLSGWVSAMQHGLSDERLEASLLSSGEYIAHHGGTVQGWVIGMYLDLLHRRPSNTEVTSWVNAMAGAMSANDVAYAIATSRECESMRITDDYLTYLGRAASQSEIHAWISIFSRGFSNEDLIAGFLGSPEYYSAASRGQGTDTGWILSVYHDVLSRAPTPQELGNWLSVLH